MSRRLIGTLTDPSGTPLAGWTLTLDARRNAAPSVPIGASESVVLDESGGYDLLITDGLYMALLTAPGDTIQRRIGLFLVATGADIDVLTLIELYSSATGFALAIEDEGVQLVAAATLINFTGAGVTASAIGNAVTVAIDGGGGGGGGVTDAEYIVATPHAGLSAERVLTGVADETSIDAATAGQIKVGLTPHLAAADPHPVYALDTDLSAYLPKALVDVKGDLLVATAADTVARKPAGVNGTFLKADSAQADGLQWAALADADIPSTIARDSELAAHEADTTAVHGIADTAALIGASYVTTAASAALSGEKVLGTDVVMRGTFAARPVASLGGRLYLATDTNGGTLYRDTGTVWEQVGQGVTEAGPASGVAAGVLSGTYPNPDFAVDMATQAELDAHVVAADPHTVYQLEAQKGAVNGYASLDAGGTVPDAQIPVGIARVVVGQAFSTFPAPSAGIAGLVLRANDAVFPAPGIDLVCDGTRWRPVNGSAVLAMRTINPITVQDTAGAVAETLGPFPGGLIRAGQRLQLEAVFGHPGIGIGVRRYRFDIGSVTVKQQWQAAVVSTTSVAYVRWPVAAFLSVLSDTSTAHNGGIINVQSYTSGSAFSNPTVDFSADWYVDVVLTSADETTKTISGATWSGGVATFTATAHTLATGDKTTVAGVTPSGYNGVHIVTVLNANTFTAPIASDPGTYTSGGTSSRISNMVSESYVLEWKG